MERLTLTVPEVALLLGISRSSAYEMVATGQLPSVPIGSRRRLVAKHVVEELVGQPVPAQASLTFPRSTTHIANG